MQKDTSTEQKIKDAARRIFIANGFDGCTSRQIAKEAGLNVALVNYYFCSKSKLFELVFKTVMEEFLLGMVDVFSTDLSLENKVRIFIEREYEFLTNHPEIPQFIISELSRNKACSMKEMGVVEKILSTGVFDMCYKAQEEGKMRKVDMVSVTMIIMANCQFPFMAKPLIQDIHGLSEEQYEQQLILHKQYVTEMIITYLFP